MSPFTMVRTVALIAGVLLLVGAFLPLAEFAGMISRGDVVITPDFTAAGGLISDSPISRLEVPVRIFNNSTSPLSEFTISIRVSIGGEIVELSSNVESVPPGAYKTVTCSVDVPREIMAKLLKGGLSVDGVYIKREDKLTRLELLTTYTNRSILMPVLNLTLINGILYFHYVNPTPVTIECTLHYTMVSQNGTVTEMWKSVVIKRYMESYIPLARGRVVGVSAELIVGGETLYRMGWKGGFQG